jgi:hypothetical protein
MAYCGLVSKALSSSASNSDVSDDDSHIYCVLDDECVQSQRFFAFALVGLLLLDVEYLTLVTFVHQRLSWRDFLARSTTFITL